MGELAGEGSPLQKSEKMYGIGATIRIGQEMQYLQYARFFFFLVSIGKVTL